MTAPLPFILTASASVAQHYLAELRDVETQRDPLRFRINISRIGMLLAYEMSRTLPYVDTTVKTPLGEATAKRLQHPLVLAPVLRAGLPLHEGFLRCFDRAESAFVAAYRGEHRADLSFDIRTEYAAAPALEGKTLVLLDPMLATGQSAVSALEALRRYGSPRAVHVVAVIAAPPGVALVRESWPEAQIWVGALDRKLNDKSYIVPGLGDARDLSFGEKI